MTLKASIKSDVVSIFLVTDDFAESVVYHLKGGGTRSIKAIVDRNSFEIYNAAGEVSLATYSVILHNNCKTGVLAKEVNNGGDKVEFITDFGEAIPEKMTVLKLVAQDEGTITLALA